MQNCIKICQPLVGCTKARSKGRGTGQITVINAACRWREVPIECALYVTCVRVRSRKEVKFAIREAAGATEISRHLRCERSQDHER